MARIRLPAALMELAGRDEIEVSGATVLQAIQALDALHPGLADRICTDQNEPRNNTLIYVDDVEIRQLHGMKTRLSGDEIIYVVRERPTV